MEVQVCFCFVCGLGYALFCFASPSLWAVGMLALFGPCVGACIYSVRGTALHVPLFHSQLFPGNFSPGFLCFFFCRKGLLEMGWGMEMG